MKIPPLKHACKIPSACLSNNVERSKELISLITVVIKLKIGLTFPLTIDSRPRFSIFTTTSLI